MRDATRPKEKPGLLRDRRLHIAVVAAVAGAIVGAVTMGVLTRAFGLNTIQSATVVMSPSPYAVTTYVTVPATPEPTPAATSDAGTPDTDTPAPTESVADNVTAEPVPERLYLADMQPVEEDPFFYGSDTMTIQGHEYKHTVGLCVSDGTDTLAAPIRCNSDRVATSWADYNLGAEYTRFSAVIGLTKRSSTNCVVDVQVTLMGQTLFAERLRYGDVRTLNKPTKGKERLRLSTTNERGNACVMGFGDAAATT